MRSISVNLKNGAYCISIGTGAYGKLLQDLTERNCGIFLVADANAMKHHSHVILDALGTEPMGIYFVDGEKEKNLTTVSNILEEMAASGMTRSDCLVAFGGGVCGDITGFCAAVYMRGIDYYQVPTTLLSQVDSSVGGKTGVDLAGGKNLAGAFKQPSGVYINSGVLDTLPPRELNQGKAEMLKAALIADESLFYDFSSGDMVSDEYIARCVEIKLDFVTNDVYDTGRRMILNFGHTIAHAIETKMGYGVIPHGEAVAIGMAVSARISESAGISEKGTAAKVREAIAKNGLPVKMPVKMETLTEIMKSDKKLLGGKLNSIFLLKPGAADIFPMSVEEFVRMGSELDEC